MSIKHSKEFISISTSQNTNTNTVSKGDKLYCILYTRFIFEVIKIDFWQIWFFDIKGTGWVGLQLSVILTLTVRRFDMWVTPYQSLSVF